MRAPTTPDTESRRTRAGTETFVASPCRRDETASELKKITATRWSTASNEKRGFARIFPRDDMTTSL
jgi:hypothetical protein